MNDYLVKAHVLIFSVTASDSDFACWEANEKAKRLRLYNPSQKAELILITDKDQDQSLGEIDLENTPYPTTWAAIKALKSDLWDEAKTMALRDWDLPVTRSRGAVLIVTDRAGAPLIASGENYELPKSLAAFRNTTASIKAKFPNAFQIFMCVGCNSAQTVSHMNDGYYTPWAGEAEALIYEYN